MMKDQKGSIRDLLRMMRRDVDQILKPEVTSPFGKYTVMTLGLMLEQLAVFHDETGDEKADRERAGLIGALGGAGSCGPIQLQLDFDDRSGNGATLSSLISTHLADRPAGEATGLVARIAKNELAMLDREKAAIKTDTESDGALMAEIEVPVTLENLNRFFAQSVEFADARAVGVWQIPGGYSKDTYMVSLTQRGGSTRDVVLRRDFPFGPTETSAADEFEVLDRLNAMGLAVAKPIVANRSDILGNPFLVTERVPGENAADHYDLDAELARAVSLQLAETLGRLHAMDPVELGLTDARDIAPQEQIRRYLARWRDFWMRNRIASTPIAEAAMIWLDANTPTDVPRIVPVHGDARQHNVMIDGTTLTALLDWEFIHAGDPSEDLQYTRLYVEPYVSWDEFIEVYLRAGGVRASESGSRYYEVFRALRNFICCDVSWSGFVTGKYPVNKLAVQGLVYRRDFLRSVAESLIRFTDSG